MASDGVLCCEKLVVSTFLSLILRIIGWSHKIREKLNRITFRQKKLQNPLLYTTVRQNTEIIEKHYTEKGTNIMHFYDRE